MSIFKNKKKDDFKKLFDLQYQEKCKEIEEYFMNLLSIQRNGLNSKGFLLSGVYDESYLDTHLKILSKKYETINNVFKDVYSKKGINKKKRKILLTKIDEFVNDNLKEFERDLDSNNLILNESKSRIKTKYKRELDILVIGRENLLKIQKRKKPSKLIEEKDIKPPSIISSIYWFASKVKEHPLYIVLIFLILLFISFPVKCIEWIGLSIDYYF